MSVEGTMQKWLVKLDDGQAVSRGSLQSASDTVRDVLKTRHSCEIWHFEDGAWALYERFEPEVADTESPLEAIRRGALQVARERGAR